MKMKIAYITVQENILSPLLKRQLIELLIEMKNIEKGTDITLVSSMTPHTMFKLRNELKNLKKMFKEKKINFFIYPMLLPFPYLKIVKSEKGFNSKFRWSKNNTKLVFCGMLPILLILKCIKGVKIFHCRSYPGTYALTVFKKLYPKVKLLFDPRSDFPEENVVAGSWAHNSIDFKFWKNSEYKILQKSDSVACIANTYVNHYKSIYADSNCFVAPNNVDIENFKPSKEHRSAIRKQYNISDNEIVFCYLGVISNHGWNRYSMYIKFLNIIKNARFKYKVLFLVPSESIDELKDELMKSNYLDKCIVLNVEYEKIPHYLSASDVGLYFLYEESIRVGTKLGEYNVCGLPVIINKNCLGSIEVLSSSKAGIVIDDDNIIDALDRIENFVSSDFDNDQIHDFAADYFSNKRIAQIYINEYLKLLNKY